MLGTLEWERFYAFAEEFVAISSTLGDNWYMKTSKEDEEDEAYLVKKVIIPDSKTSLRDDIADVESAAEDEVGIQDLEKQGAEAASPSDRFFTYEYHVIYSHSYSVPVLYLIACHSDGRPLRLEEVWDKVPSSYQSLLGEQKWSILTQQEHPKLGIPCFMLHPCHTADLMKSALSVASESSSSRANYLVTWLSAVGPLVGLNLSMEYSKCIVTDTKSKESQKLDS